jgi:hypothetical protein
MGTAEYDAQATLARDAFHSAIMQDLVPLDPSFKALPWLPIEGKALKIARVGRGEAIQFLTVAQSIESGQDFTVGDFQAAVPFDVKEFRLKTIATDRPVDERIVRELSEPHLQEEFAVQLGTEAVMQRFCRTFIYGSEATPAPIFEFNGLIQLSAGPQTQASSGKET